MLTTGTLNQLDLLGDQLYRTILETSPDAIVLVAPDGTILLGNSVAAVLHGFHQPGELRGVNMFTLLLHEEHARAMQHLGDAVDLGSITGVELTLLRTDGSSFPAELSISAIRNLNKEPEAFIAIVRDITERNDARQKIQNLLEEVRDAHGELERSYDATLQGWSSALDLRDKETEGHSRRVTEVSMLLARTMGLSRDDLIHAWRGALLHDIGKMGIPDAILLKPGPLTDEEWEVMRKHPAYAKELLSSVKFLNPALDIPYYHHEKWDGTGYPQGLKGTEIPLAARIFAVVDVWDALSSDRPYRAAWPQEQVMEHIKAQAGTHFDPAVVEQFQKLDLSQVNRSRNGNFDELKLYLKD